MNLMKLQYNWIDILVLLLLVVGVMRGRRRGMSQELLDVIKWTLIVVIAAFAYEPGGRILAQTAVFSLLTSYVGVYALTLIAIFVLFSCIRSWTGEKLVGSDTFGNAEYYLGMLAGPFRYACVMLVFLAFLNARYFSPQEIQARINQQVDLYGKSFFPPLGEIQRTVFEQSMSGRFVRDHLQLVLIRPTSPTDRIGTRRAQPLEKRNRDISDVMRR